MAKMIQIRNVPDDVHMTLKARAAREGMSLSDYVKRELGNLAKLDSMRDWLASTKKLKPIRSNRTGADLIRELRDGR